MTYPMRNRPAGRRSTDRWPETGPPETLRKPSRTFSPAHRAFLPLALLTALVAAPAWALSGGQGPAAAEPEDERARAVEPGSRAGSAEADIRIEPGAEPAASAATPGPAPVSEKETATGSVRATEKTSATFDERITVEGTGLGDLAEVPGGVAVVSEAEIVRSRAHHLGDVLAFVPGVVAQSRWGADESRVSVRGSGLRNNFHHRGLNLLINGIPYGDADGFSDFESLDLLATERIEIWKGANALRYGGNSMGGAINLVTPTGETAPPIGVSLRGGSYGMLRAGVATGGEAGRASWYLSASATELEGYRDHSEQGRARVFGNLSFALSDRAELFADLIYADVDEDLPGALTRQEFESDPRQANAQNVIGDWGRFYEFGRVAAGVRRQVGARGELSAVVHGQVRDTIHPIFQVLDQDSRNFGAELRYERRGEPGARLESVVVGLAPQIGSADESRFANVAGESGALVSRFETEAENLGLYAEAGIRLTGELSLLLGARADRAERTYTDRFLTDGDRSDERAFEAVSPKVGLLWQAAPGVQVFGNVSRSYEPPLLLELTGFGAPGFLPVEPQDTWQVEIGTRGGAGRLAWDVAVYDAEIDDEIVNRNLRPFPGAPFTVPSYRNAERSRHRGVELGLDADLARSWLAEGDSLRWRSAYTWSEFRFVDDPDFGDNDLPGAPEHLLRAELRYRHARGWWLAPTLDWSPDEYWVDSANTVESDAYAALHLGAGTPLGPVEVVAELTNLADEVYSASVQVDSADGRFFEPSTPRSAYLGIRWRR